MSDNARYAIAGVGVAGMMRAGCYEVKLLAQVGKYYTPASAGMGVAGLMSAGCLAQGTALRIIEQDGFSVADEGAAVVPTASFRIVCQPDAAPRDGDPVVIALGTLRQPIFGGYLVNPEATEFTPEWVSYACTAQGWTRDVSRRLVTAAWTEKYAGQIAREVLATYAPNLIADDIADGVYLAAHSATYATALAVCQALAARSGCVFSVDAARHVHFAPAETLPAPWDITSGTQFSDLKITQDASQLVNRCVVLFSEMRDAAQSFVGDGATVDFTMAYAPHEVSALTVNGAAVTFGTHYAEDNADKDFSVDYERGVINTRKHATLTASDTLSIAYTAKIPARLTRTHAASVAARAAIEGSDGVYEMLIDDREISSLKDARTRADEEFAQYAFPRVSASYTRVDSILDLLGNRLRVGMLQRLNFWGVDEWLEIQKVTLSALNNINDYRLHFRQAVELGRRAASLESAIADTLAATDATAAVVYEEVR